MKKDYELTEKEYQEILEINKAGGDPAILLTGGVPIGRSLQQKINDYWATLGQERGFDPLTVQPGDTVKKFTAEMTEEKEQPCPHVNADFSKSWSEHDGDTTHEFTDCPDCKKTLRRTWVLEEGGPEVVEVRR